MTRACGRAGAAVIATAAALSFGVIACAVEKKGNTVGADSARATPSPVATSAPDTTAAKGPVTGGERDSAGTAVFEIGADGKLRRVKR